MKQKKCDRRGIRTNRAGGRGATIEALEGRILLAADLAGNTILAARAITVSGTAASYADWVGSTDTRDYYAFTLGAQSNLSLSMTGLAADADVAVVNSYGTVLAISQRSGTTSEAISATFAAGTYYIKVYPYSGSTNYTLTVSATATPPDGAGNTRSAAKDLGTLGTTTITAKDYVGATDTSDYYKFAMGAGDLSLALTGLSADADVRLYNSAGTLIKSSINDGTANEAISASLAAGTYYVQVVRYSGNTNYTLSLTGTVAVVPDTTTTTTTTSTAAATIVARNLTALTELDITGSADNDTILVTQSGTTLTITSNGNTTTYATTGIGEIAIWGAAGNDSITVDASVTLNVRMYGGAGTDTLVNRTQGRATIVAIGGGVDSLTGNGANTSFWFDTSDTAATTSADTAAKRVHRVSAFYQPYTTNTTSTGYVPLDLSGQNLQDPSDSGTTVRYTNRSFWGAAPAPSDVNQGGLGDCYLLATLAGMAQSSPARLLETAVDLGDGTYAVQFYRSGVATFVRVDGDLAASGSYLRYNDVGASKALWACIMEKAYAVFAYSAHTYASIEGGLMSTVFTSLGVTSQTVNPQTLSAATLYSYVSTALAAGRAVTLGTITSPSGAPVVGNHAYTVVGVSKDAYGNITYTLRNPWGVDGVSNSSTLSDGIVTLTAAQITKNFNLGTWSTG